MKSSIEKEFAQLVSITNGTSHSIRFRKKDCLWLLRLDSVVVKHGTWGFSRNYGRQTQDKRKEFLDTTLEGLLTQAVRWIKRRRRAVRNGEIKREEST